MIRAIFFDIDGTLISMKTRRFEQSLIDALHELQAKGIRLAIASGRPPVQLPLLGEAFNAYPWDAYVMMNGQYCMDQERQAFYRLPIPKEALESLVPWLKEHADYPCSFYELSYSYDIAWNQGMYEYLKSIGKEDTMAPVDDPIRALTHETYQICPYIPPEMDAEWLKHAPGMKSARWTDQFADMIPAEGGKPEGIRRVLERWNLTPEECMTYGDGGNDISMLAFAGTGVAMGQAADEVKQAADYVTDACEDDGILKAFRHFGLLE